MAQIDYICLLPIVPNTTLEELAASRLEKKIIPFTSADFTLTEGEMVAKLKRDIERGARGLKLHPILQNISLSDPRTHAAVEVLGEAGLPITSHCGINEYYLPDSPYRKETNAEFGDVKYVIELCHTFPDYNIVAAHGGGTVGGEMEILARETRGLKNVYTDTSFRNANIWSRR